MVGGTRPTTRSNDGMTRRGRALCRWRAHTSEWSSSGCGGDLLLGRIAEEAHHARNDALRERAHPRGVVAVDLELARRHSPKDGLGDLVCAQRLHRAGDRLRLRGLELVFECELWRVGI